ncbi:thermonuclease family protein [Methylorubrum sp. B1-46]|uniref:thermonuclease family protein n=1 Tax=Methylorubrum sp. B1-46 TaxID=2897334 RepID=UPI001E471A94|nr:thermonuclease family protein [Methylorubrum sp. B1-46]UGB26240.1 thermonuclease family protein [Methylorubrum sp. B1-46]
MKAETINGRASVIDGDTLDIRGTRFRLQGVDTPESAQMCGDANGKDYPCGRRAAFALSDKIGHGNVACEVVDKDRYGRSVAVCRTGGEDLNAWLVAQGWGMAYRQYSTAYVRHEEEAKAEKRGIWVGQFTPPWDWRRGHRAADTGTRPAEAATAEPRSVKPPARTAAGCEIKGNVNRKGDRIYHIPGSRDYDRTVINEGSGERMFCTEEEARSAGWRAPRS